MQNSISVRAPIVVIGGTNKGSSPSRVRTNRSKNDHGASPVMIISSSLINSLGRLQRLEDFEMDGDDEDEVDEGEEDEGGNEQKKNNTNHHQKMKRSGTENKSIIQTDQESTMAENVGVLQDQQQQQQQQQENIKDPALTMDLASVENLSTFGAFSESDQDPGATALLASQSNIQFSLLFGTQGNHGHHYYRKHRRRSTSNAAGILGSSERYHRSSNHDNNNNSVQSASPVLRSNANQYHKHQSSLSGDLTQLQGSSPRHQRFSPPAFRKKYPDRQARIEHRSTQRDSVASLLSSKKPIGMTTTPITKSSTSKSQSAASSSLPATPKVLSPSPSLTMLPKGSSFWQRLLQCSLISIQVIFIALVATQQLGYWQWQNSIQSNDGNITHGNNSGLCLQENSMRIMIKKMMTFPFSILSSPVSPELMVSNDKELTTERDPTNSTTSITTESIDVAEAIPQPQQQQQQQQQADTTRIPDKTTIPLRIPDTNEKYLLLDYSPWLGFNNMRYMIERGLYLSKLLNRTLVLPSQLRIRKCLQPGICLLSAKDLNLNTIGRNPQQSTMGLDLGYFFDLNHLSCQETSRVIDFRVFMEDVVGIPKIGIPLVDSEFGNQVRYWQEWMDSQEEIEKAGYGLNGEKDLKGMREWDGNEDGYRGRLVEFRAKNENEGGDDDDDDDEDDVGSEDDDEETVEEEEDDDENEISGGENKGNDSNKVKGTQSTSATSTRRLKLVRIKRSEWDLPMDPTLKFTDNLIRNGLVDSLSFAKPLIRKLDHSSGNNNVGENIGEAVETEGEKIFKDEPGQDNGSFITRQTFFAFGDVRGGGLHKIVNWTVDFLHQVQEQQDQQQPQQQQQQSIISKPLLDARSCFPPIEDDSVESIPWEARFPSFATCRISNYQGFQQKGEIFKDDADLLSIQGQFHITGWIPLIYSSKENAEKYQQMAVGHLKYSPKVQQAADWLIKRLKEIIEERSRDGKDEIIEESKVEKTGNAALPSSSTPMDLKQRKKRDRRRLLSLPFRIPQQQQDEQQRQASQGLFDREQQHQQHQHEEQKKSKQESQSKSNDKTQDWFRLAMHVRRGDFVKDKYGWQDFDDSWMKDLVQQAVDSEFGTTEATTTTTTSRSNDDDQEYNSLPLKPLPKIGFYMATDETSPTTLAHFRSLGAILFNDLLTLEFTREFGHLMVFEDWVGLVEQLICVKSKMFYGTMTSSFTSGIGNMRLIEYGMDQDSFRYFLKVGGPVLAKEQMEQNS